MINDVQQRREIEEAIVAANNALTHLERARAALSSAGNWGLLDIFGGNTLTGLLKHGKMSKAEREIADARYALAAFSRELRDVQGYTDIHINDFLSFADFFFDGFIVDIWVQSKISQAKKECDEAIRRVTDIRNRLLCM
ncbi:MAG: hypothetical protein K5891_09565 [Lachnospiraceae bacterium]|nr:hypothetical protein [Lachnospiraceae bacterium]